MTKYFTKLLPLVLFLVLFVAACQGTGENQNDAEVPAATAKGLADSHASPPATGEQLCIAHAVAASQCFICDASLRDAGRLWCREHARYEDRCFECHPELREAGRLYCDEHGLYEDECFLCHPELKLEESSIEPPEAPIDLAESRSTLFCNEHNVPELECGICQPTLADGLQLGQGLKIRLPSTSSEEKARIVAAHPQAGQAGATVHAVGQLGFNLNRLVHITPLTDGVVRRVQADLGREVQRGDILAELSSPEIAEAKASLLKAVAEEKVSSEVLSRERDLFEKKVSSAQDFYAAEARHATALANLRAAEQMLLDLGFDQQRLDRIVSEQEARSLMPLTAPFDGTVIARDAVTGDVVSVGDAMFTVTDLSTLWLDLAVSEIDVVRLRVGQRVELRSPAIPHEVTGVITWISSRLNETTRMAEVRAEVSNADGLLRAGMFVDADIIVGDPSASLLVPRASVHRFGGKPFVFVRLDGDLYELRRVEVRPASESLTGVTAGLSDRDVVAVERSYLLKSEFQKSRLGAGCVD